MNSGAVKESVRVAAEYQPLFRQIGFDSELVFKDPRIKSWRKLPDRENCIWDLVTSEDMILRLHVKRYTATRNQNPADAEAAGLRMLEIQEIPTAKLVAWGTLRDGRSFVIIRDLSGFKPADKLVEGGTPFEQLLIPTADLAAALHNANLHHRDLYLCHFMARFMQDEDNTIKTDLRLIDAARVGRMSGMFLRRRWIVKDLAQFWFSTLSLPISDEQRRRWLEHYCGQCKIEKIDSLRRSIERKSKSISIHDQRVRKKQPTRNISIPSNG